MEEEGWKRTWASSERNIQRVAQRLQSTPRVAPLHILRVDQLDAAVIDTEVVSLLTEPVSRALAIFGPSLANKYKPEIDAVVRFLILWFSILSGEPSPGMRFQNLIYRDERQFSLRSHRAPPTPPPPLPKVAAGAAAGGIGAGGGALRMHSLSQPGVLTRGQRLGYGVCSVCLPWAWSRLQRYGVLHGWGGLDPTDARAVAWAWLGRLEVAWRSATLVNLLLFLRNGRYSTLLDRLLRARLVYPDSTPVGRSIVYDHLNRQLIWDGLTSFVLFLMPLFRWSRLWASASRLLRSFRRAGTGSALSRADTEAGRRARHEEGSDADSHDGNARLCARCGQQAHMPHSAACGHVFCYFCIASLAAAGERYCPDCGGELTVATRVSASVPS